MLAAEALPQALTGGSHCSQAPVYTGSGGNDPQEGEDKGKRTHKRIRGKWEGNSEEDNYCPN